MHPFSIVTLGIFIAGYSTARWDLVTQLYELAIFAWNHGVVVCRSSQLGQLVTNAIEQTRAAKGFGILSAFFVLLVIPIYRFAVHEADLHPRTAGGISAREQLRRRGSF